MSARRLLTRGAGTAIPRLGGRASEWSPTTGCECRGPMGRTESRRAPPLQLPAIRLHSHTSSADGERMSVSIRRSGRSHSPGPRQRYARVLGVGADRAERNPQWRCVVSPHPPKRLPIDQYFHPQPAVVAVIFLLCHGMHLDLRAGRIVRICRLPTATISRAPHAVTRPPPPPISPIAPPPPTAAGPPAPRPRTADRRRRRRAPRRPTTGRPRRRPARPRRAATAAARRPAR